MNTDNRSKKQFTKRPFNTKDNKGKRRNNNTPEHIRNLVYLVRNNAEIRRFTALGIINMMKQKQFIPTDAKCYINFGINKYGVSVNGFKQEHSYNNSIFITALAAAFPSFAYNANKIINTFLEVENAQLNENDVAGIADAIKDNNNSPVEEEQSSETISEQ